MIQHGHIHVYVLYVAATLARAAGLGEPLNHGRRSLPVLPPLFALALAPLLLGVINRTKAFFAGRRGPPLLQPYRDLCKCLRRGAVYGDVTTWVFRAGPVVNLAALDRPPCSSCRSAVWRRR